MALSARITEDEFDSQKETFEPTGVEIFLTQKPYHDGDKVFVEKCDTVDVGDVGIFVVNGDVYIKELGNNCLISHNEKYKPIHIGENDSVYCCGRVIGIV